RSIQCVGLSQLERPALYRTKGDRLAIRLQAQITFSTVASMRPIDRSAARAALRCVRLYDPSLGRGRTLASATLRWSRLLVRTGKTHQDSTQWTRRKDDPRLHPYSIVKTGD